MKKQSILLAVAFVLTLVSPVQAMRIPKPMSLIVKYRGIDFSGPYRVKFMRSMMTTSRYSGSIALEIKLRYKGSPLHICWSNAGSYTEAKLFVDDFLSAIRTKKLIRVELSHLRKLNRMGQKFYQASLRSWEYRR